MQIRRKGSKIQLLRSMYLSAKKRSTQTMVASFDSWRSAIPTDVMDKLTNEEITEVQAWLDNREAERKEAGRKSAINNAASYIKQVADALDAGEPTLDQLAAMRDQVKELNKAIRRAERKAKKTE